MPRPVDNPPNPWSSTHVEWLGPPPASRLRVYEETARSILTGNDSPDVPFRWSVNPYRGCAHACAYCYARPGHQLLDFGAGTDFDARIVVKTNAPELLRRGLARRSWSGESIAFSGVTDCYQPLEASYGLTRRCLEACVDFRNPAALITKSALVRRDLDLIRELHRVACAQLFVSIPFLDERVGRLVEPGAAPPARRFETLRVFAEAGVPTGVAIAPVIPGLNEADVAGILERAAGAGATRAFLICLRLPAEVEPVFRARIEAAFPDRAARILSAVRQVRGGRTNDARFGARMGGQGPRWRAIERLFEVQCRRLGLAHGRGAEELGPDRPRSKPAAGPPSNEPGPRSDSARGAGPRAQQLDLFGRPHP